MHSNKKELTDSGLGNWFRSFFPPPCTRSTAIQKYGERQGFVKGEKLCLFCDLVDWL